MTGQIRTQRVQCEFNEEKIQLYIEYFILISRRGQNCHLSLKERLLHNDCSFLCYCVTYTRILRISKDVENVLLEISEANTILQGRLSSSFFLFPFGSLFLCSLIEYKDGLRERSRKREDLYLNVAIFEFFRENTFGPLYGIA